METRPTPTEAPVRLHALDNLRALLMWLGIVLHVAVIHMVDNAPLSWRDPQRTRVADLLVAFIHAFRMPTFFILAGFFVALLLQSRGAAGMARHRALRLGAPFALLWPIVFAATVVLAMGHLHLATRGTWGLDAAVVPASPTGERGLHTMHLWFIWMLLLFCLLTAALARVVPARCFAPAATVLQRLGAAPWGPLVLALPLAFAGLGYPNGVVAPSGRFLPPAAEWLHNGLFYGFGLALFHAQWELFALYRKHWARFALAGVLPFLATGALVEQHGAPIAIAYIYNVVAWLWSFAALGLALKTLDRRSPVLGYLAESSYWVYVIHLPLTIVFGTLLYGFAWPALAKMAINIAATTLVCLASYHLLVRFTWLGALLNGKRHARSPRPPLEPSHVSS